MPLTHVIRKYIQPKLCLVISWTSYEQLPATQEEIGKDNCIATKSSRGYLTSLQKY